MNHQEIWELYQRGVEHHSMENMYEETKRNYNFYIGNQWEGCKTGKEELPVLNFIKPVCRYKISMIAQNQMGIVYNDLSSESKNGQVCNALTAFAGTVWEQSQMDTRAWEIIKNACITGDHYLYCYDATTHRGGVAGQSQPQLKMREVSRCNLYLSDEQNPQLEEQEYLLIAERLPVSKVREMGKKNGVSQKELEKITADEETELRTGQNLTQEVKTQLGKCTSLLFMQKTPQGIAFCRSTQQVIYEPMQVISGLDRYPIAAMRWETLPGSARGMGAVQQMIANQLEVNKTAARRAVVVKRYAYPIMVYDNARVPDPEQLLVAGALVGVDNLENMPMSSILQYIHPAPLSPDAERLQNELILRTKELEGAADAAMGQVDPTKASGEAIKAVRDQAAMVLNEQIGGYRQFVEDLALIWFQLWTAYHPQGMTIRYRREGKDITQTISAKELKAMQPEIRIDISPVDPFSRLSQEIAMERLLQMGHITFEEYVEALPATSSVPKNKLQEILQSRGMPPNGERDPSLPPISALNLEELLQRGGKKNEMSVL